MTNARRPRASFMEHVMRRRFLVGVTALVGLSLGVFGEVGSAHAQAGPLCTPFAEGAAGQEGWGACPGAPNIVVTTTNVGSIGGPTDYHLHLRDTSGASAACSTDQKYTGNWIEKMGGCGEFCFDFKVFKSGTPPGAITPSFSIYSGTKRFVFAANFTVTSSDPWRQKICAPVRLLQPGEPLLSGSSGAWQAVAPTTPADWNNFIQNVTSISFPIDWTSDPSEEAGYDNLCMTPGPCPPPPPPEIKGCLEDMKVAVKCNPDGTYTVTLNGGSFSGNDITLTSQTAGVTVAPPQQPWSATTTWTISGATPGQTVVLTANATKVGGGTEPGTDQCCAGEIRIVMPECKPPVDVKVEKEDTPAGGGGHWFNLWITNVGAPISFPAGGITITEKIPTGMTVTGVTGTGWSCLPPTIVGPGAMLCTFNLAGSLGTSAQLSNSLVVHYTTTGPGPFKNCATVAIGSSVGVDGNPTNDTACVTVTPNDGKIDLGIEKTGGTSPVAQVNAYAFHLKVTNVGTPFNGTNNIVVTDIVPTGMTFTGATGPNWTCNAPPSLSAGQTLSCTYTGTGAASTGQSLGTIDIAAIANGPPPYPPFTNCAVVGLTTGSGLHDTNSTNDKACVTVTKPPLACPPPMVPGPIPGQCICPQPMHLVNGKCIGTPPPPPPTCTPPKVPGPVPGICICPQGKVDKGGKCVSLIECRSPLISNAAGTDCVCRPGLVRKGRTCVEQIVCNPPAKLNRRGACECPTDMVAKGKGCVERERRPPQVFPGDIIRNIPGDGRDNDKPRGGRDTDNPRGGGQGSPDFPGRR